MSFLGDIKSYCEKNGLSTGQYEIVYWKNLDLSYIKAGALFVHAAWSGPSVQSLRFFLKNVCHYMPSAGFTVLFVDADESITDEVLCKLSIKPQGNGEVFWIKNGNFIHGGSQYGKPDDKILIQQMMKECLDSVE